MYQCIMVPWILTKSNRQENHQQIVTKARRLLRSAPNFTQMDFPDLWADLFFEFWENRPHGGPWDGGHMRTPCRPMGPLWAFH